MQHKIGLIAAKIVSYIIAFTATWLLSRWFTFPSQDRRRVRK
ncbi:GtrA family protein [Coxiella-like endosymbiont]|nr:GtrA family protein [Coxiella-like endosymbiont]